ncbi:hypothetical protein G4Z16_10580 [Streptomyces bathyalis]|uniref:Uncharacterized protein n=1 Tax=Streptomyces bathyalis TaxID=2710756 RepID=A0A7T1T5H8_9ACTN|nr:hypothetical protein [Streptomyces bathyalis]QPP06764.1 hypothetical protein G4Z16_10580 [Streptomyces bathyalis]
MRRNAIETELKRLKESAKYSGQMQFELTKQWRSVNLLLGLQATVLAAISGAAALISFDYLDLLFGSPVPPTLTLENSCWLGSPVPR